MIERLNKFILALLAMLIFQGFIPSRIAVLI